MSVLYKHNDEIERVAGSYRPIIYSPQPDWANAVPITKEQVVAGYTVPSDGMIVGWGLSRVENFFDLRVNNVTVSRTRQSSGASGAYSNTQVPVNKGDILKSVGTFEASDFHFVPWKE